MTLFYFTSRLLQATGTAGTQPIKFHTIDKNRSYVRPHNVQFIEVSEIEVDDPTAVCNSVEIEENSLASDSFAQRSNLKR